MSRHLHIDAVTGVSGDMLLGALLDAGAPVDDVRGDLDGLAIGGWDLTVERVTRRGLTGTLATIDTTDTARHRAAAELIGIIADAGLPAPITRRAVAVIERIAAVEAAIHGIALADVHFHEVGALDTIIDVVGVCSALHRLDVGSVTCGPLPTGAGTVRTAHGVLPVPAPATLALIAGTELEWIFTDDPMELVTPTGAALVAEFARPAVGRSMTVSSIGYGFGQSTRLPRANCCRVTLGTASGASRTSTDRVVRLGTTIDDQSPESLAVALSDLLEAGALDVWSTPVVMKKGRLASDVTVLCHLDDEAQFVDRLFAHTTTLGVRREVIERHVAAREFVVVDVDGQTIRVKVRRRNGAVIAAKPELDDCRRAAVELGRSLDDVRERALGRFESSAGGV
jgi:pyridinium-3,5-bisthiocarboxylic acid mononucleotide nickel chelatase